MLVLKPPLFTQETLHRVDKYLKQYLHIHGRFKLAIKSHNNEIGAFEGRQVHSRR